LSRNKILVGRRYATGRERNYLATRCGGCDGLAHPRPLDPAGKSRIRSAGWASKWQAEFSGESMSNATIEPLILDLLEWLAIRERTYEEVMDAWRTCCPRLTVWEDANERGLISAERRGAAQIIAPTPAGLALLENRRRSASL
jgi:hypothetical protein